MMTGVDRYTGQHPAMLGAWWGIFDHHWRVSMKHSLPRKQVFLMAMYLGAFDHLIRLPLYITAKHPHSYTTQTLHPGWKLPYGKHHYIVN